MELIDKAALPEHKFPEVQCNGFGDGPAYRQGWNDAIDAIVDNAPPVDAVPVRHGRWIGGEIGKCSACGYEGCSSDIWNTGDIMFCPNCGARMDGDDNGKT